MNKQSSIQRALSLRKSLSARKKQSGSAKKRILIILLILLAAAMLLLPVIMWLSHVLPGKRATLGNVSVEREADRDIKARYDLKKEKVMRHSEVYIVNGPNNSGFDNGNTDE